MSIKHGQEIKELQGYVRELEQRLTKLETEAFKKAYNATQKPSKAKGLSLDG